MSKKSRLSRDQKRKQKLAKRNRRLPELILPYTGNRYRSKEFVKPLCATEQGVYDAYVISGREITDGYVEDELLEFIGELRSRPAAELIFDAESGENAGQKDVIPTMILSHWHRLLDERSLPPRDDLIGILRTILDSIDVWRSKNLSSRGYLNYLEGFMLRLGYRVEVLGSDDDTPCDEEPDELYEIGQMWLAGSPEARQRFTALANELLGRGESQTVIEVSRRLLGEIGSVSRPEFPILSELAIRAQKEQRDIASPPAAPGLKSLISRLTGW